MLHVGTLFAVCVFYYKLLWSLIKSFFGLIKKIFTGKFSWKNRTDDENMIFMLIIGLLPLFLLFVPVPGTDMVFKDVSEMFSGNKYLIYVASFLVITSILLWIGIACNKRTCTHAIHSRKDLEDEDGRKNYNVLDAICVGVMQVFATLPGISRSGSTLAVGEMRGINKQKAIDYTFILGIPTILASAVFELKDALGYLAIIIFKWFLKTDKMYIFAIYTAVIGIVGIIIALIEMNCGFNIFSHTPL